MNREQLEFSISQYLDGTLSVVERAALVDQLASDSEAQQLLAEYQTLDAALRRELPAPEVHWDRLAEQLSSVVGEEEIEPQVIRIPWRATSLALAASLLIAVTLVSLLYKWGSKNTPPAPVAVIKVEGPAAEVAAAPAVAQILVGPAAEVAESDYHLSEGIVYRPSSVSLIASYDQTGQDTQRSLYQR